MFLCPPGKNLDSQNALEDLAHFEVVAQLRKASTSVSILDHLNHNGTSAGFHLSSRQDELPPAIWSPGAQHSSPEGGGRLTANPTAVVILNMKSVNAMSMVTFEPAKGLMLIKKHSDRCNLIVNRRDNTYI